MSTTNLTIRPVTSKDRNQWQDLFENYAKFYDNDPGPGTEPVWQWILDKTEPFYANIAYNRQGEAVGLVQYQTMHRSLSGTMVVYLSDLFVSPDARGQGVGRALIDHVRQFAADRGFASVRWLTHETNDTARRLYDLYAPATGFILYAIEP
ncbi:hypothetical protein BFP70_03315 [Thioclava sp. SK-1]|uniref:GNAT family N-acetyltransferase n=1 Tax=Thioclava sp. SK-1 TaxID=1889770 RepID=UPI000824F803|nr:GNAT family N-acetyltransferase [Thioclava sp. SK-1]OCX67195.1 hypothetical protein BFP70_03315 [Thioclava sp. SK-1]